MENIELSPWGLWSGAIGWTLVGILFVKMIIYPYKKKFKLGIWLGENTVDVIRGVLLTLITVKLGDIVVQILSLTGLNIGGVTDLIKDAGLDPVQLSLVIAMVFQFRLHKRRKDKEADEILREVSGVGGQNPVRSERD